MILVRPLLPTNRDKSASDADECVVGFMVIAYGGDFADGFADRNPEARAVAASGDAQKRIFPDGCHSGKVILDVSGVWKWHSGR